MERCRLILTLAVLATVFLAGCQESPDPGATPPPALREQGGLSIVSGSENKSLEPIIQRFARKTGIHIDVTYMGSVEIGLELAKGTQCPFDAVWPASTLWVEVFDEGKVAKCARSILRTPVVFAVKKSVAEKIGQ